MEQRGLILNKLAAATKRCLFREIACNFPNKVLSITVTNGTTTVSSGIAWADPSDHSKKFKLPFFDYYVMPFDLFALDSITISGSSLTAAYVLRLYLVDSTGTRIAQQSFGSYIEADPFIVSDLIDWSNTQEIRLEPAYDIYPNNTNPMIYANGIELVAEGSAGVGVTLTAVRVFSETEPYRVRLMGKDRTYAQMFPGNDPLKSQIKYAPLDLIPRAFLFGPTNEEADFELVTDTVDFSIFFSVFTFKDLVLDAGGADIRPWPKKQWSHWWIQKVAGAAEAPTLVASGLIAYDGLSYTQVYAHSSWNPMTFILSNPSPGPNYACTYELFMA